MKKRFLSLVLGICFSFISLFSLTSCSLVKTDEDKANSEVILKVGDVDITKKDIKSAFSTYYQNNSSYFSYNTNEVIEESFYQWVIARHLLNSTSANALYDADTNKNGFIYYTQEDAEDVWNSVLEYIYSQVSSLEKKLYSQAGVDEKKYPTWLQDEEEENEDSKFESYTPSTFDIDENRIDKAVKKLTDDEVKAKLNDVTKYLFEYVSEKNEDGNDVRKDIEEKYFAKRNQAYANYVSSLVASAKANGTSTDKKTCLEEDLLSIYKAYYNSKITSIYQNYILNDYLSQDETALGNDVVVKAFVEAYYAQKQNYSTEKEYISKITDSNGAPLILYSYNGENYFFSVQHILVKFSDYINDRIGEIPEYTSSSAAREKEITDVFKEKRQDIVDENELGLLTKVNLDAGFDSVNLEDFGNYYYFDEELENSGIDTVKHVYNGYVKLVKNEDGSYQNHFDSTKYDEDKVVFMVNLDDIKRAYNYNYNTWKGYVSSYYDAEGEAALEIREAHADMDYVFDTVDTMKSNSKELPEILEKVASYLFIELEWAYSGDKLGNELSNKIGYVISNYLGENGSWVADFATGSRELASAIKNGEIDLEAIFDVDGEAPVSGLLKAVTTEYGVHLIKVENVYKPNTSIGNFDQVIEGLEINFDVSTDEGRVFVETVADFMQSTYICAGSNETLYDYYYDKIYGSLVGTSSASGTYFVSIEYKWLNDLYTDNKIVYVNKLGYDDLLALI